MHDKCDIVKETHLEWTSQAEQSTKENELKSEDLKTVIMLPIGTYSVRLNLSGTNLNGLHLHVGVNTDPSLCLPIKLKVGSLDLLSTDWRRIVFKMFVVRQTALSLYLSPNPLPGTPGIVNLATLTIVPVD